MEKKFQYEATFDFAHESNFCEAGIEKVTSLAEYKGKDRAPLIPMLRRLIEKEMWYEAQILYQAAMIRHPKSLREVQEVARREGNRGAANKALEILENGYPTIEEWEKLNTKNTPGAPSF